MTRSLNVRRKGRLALVTTSVALAASACTFVSPVQTDIPQPLGDGASTTIDLSDGSKVNLENFLIVGSQQGGPGTLAGAVSTTSGKPVTVQLTAGANAAPLSVQVQPEQLSVIGGSQNPGSIPSVDASPGSYVQMSAKVDSGGTASWMVPVLAPEGPYASLSPAAALPSPSESASPSATP